MLMNCVKLLLHAGLPVAVLSSVGFSQTTASPPAENDIVQLSPFTVDSSTDDGYRANSTISGSRLNSELKDVAASVTVLTQDFLDDLGALDLATGLSMVAGTETAITTDETTGSLSQGYIGGDFGDRNTREGDVRVRGLGRASNAANFIAVNGAPDRYNIARVEFLRGPNSILFGLGQPAGLVNYATKRALLNNSFDEVSVVVDNFGSRRGVLDFSRVLKDDVWGVRVVAKSSRTQYLFDHAYQDDDRLFLTTTYRPLQNTSLTAFYETADADGRRPNYRLVQDNVSGWLKLWNEAQSTMTPEQIANNFYWDPYHSMVSNGAAPDSPDVWVEGRDGGLFNPNLREGLDGNDKAFTAYYDGRDWSAPMDGFFTRYGTRTPSGGQPSNAASVRARTAFARSNDPLEDRDAGYTDPQAVDQGIFPWKQIDLGALPGNYRINSDEKLHLNLEQKITDDWFFSATFQTESYLQDQLFSPIAQQQSISIDINTTTADGRVNPNFLRPFVYGRSIASYTETESENLLLQTSYDLDFRGREDRFSWLGRHRLVGFLTASADDTSFHRYGMMIQNSIPDVITSAVDNSTRHVYPIFYVGDPVQPGDTALRFTGFPANTVPYRNQSYDYKYYTNANSARGEWLFSPEQVELGKVTFTNSPTRSVIEAKGYGGSMQSFLWNNRIVTTLGWREDSVDLYDWERILDANGDPIGDGSSASHFAAPAEPSVAITEATLTKGVVIHLMPWLRVFANESENFDLTTPRVDNLYRPIPPQSGVTEEWGVGFNVIENKLDVRFTAYETSQTGESVGTSIARNRIPSFEGIVFNALENAGRSDEYYAVVGYDSSGPVLQQAVLTGEVSVDGVPAADGAYAAANNVASTQDSVSRGWEVGFTYNPAPGWRFSGSFSQLANAATNRQHEVLDYLDFRSEFWGGLFAEGMHTNGDTNATVYAPDEVPPDDNSLLSERLLSIMGNELLEDLEAEGQSNQGVSKYYAKLTANYAFREGRLQGLALGTNLRWESGKVIGSRLKDATTSLGGLDNVATRIGDPAHAFRGWQHITGGVMINYRQRIMNDRVNWRIQLNVNNLFREGGDLRIIKVNPDGSPVYGINNPVTYQLSNTFTF